ncbi:Protein OPI10 [Madurella mycetomatis]|uniref:Protein OPI10 n=1 Tax=Madurella mycetomatis TaxID=100816 RepID=A0A175W121_9PEZI|nr:Protein OPI10 [Madurella mycetomatis]
MSQQPLFGLVPAGQPVIAQPNFKFLGGIGPGKESAIFKLGGTSATSHDGSAHNGGGSSNVVIGISVEPAESVAARIREIGSGNTDSGALVPLGAGRQQPNTLVLAERIIKNAFNFLASFSGTAGQVPLKAFEDWWRKFESRVRSDPGFLERDE